MKSLSEKPHQQNGSRGKTVSGLEGKINQITSKINEKFKIMSEENMGGLWDDTWFFNRNI